MYLPVLALLFTGVAGFVPPAHRPRFAANPTSGSALYGIRCEDKTYQLEEREDKDTCTTEVFLNADHTMTFGETDGPVWDSAVGAWNVVPGTDDYKMVIKRRYGTGQESTDMGQFTYEIVRTYVGEMTNVGESVGITGVMNLKDEDLDTEKEVGYFNMIDGTDEKASYEEKARKLSSS